MSLMVKTGEPSKRSLDGKSSCILGCFPRGGITAAKGTSCLLVMESREPPCQNPPRVLQTSVQANKRTGTSGEL